jgi:hypothetical protein
LAQGVSARLTAAQGRRFGLTVGIAFLVLTAVLVWRAREVPAMVTGSLGGLLILAGLLVPTRLGPVERGWMAFAHKISKVTTPIVMGIVYFLVVAPIGAVMRAFGKNPLRSRGHDGSLWVSRTGEPRGGMGHQF